MGDFCQDAHEATKGRTLLLFFVLIEMPIIIFLSNYSFLLGSGCFHNSPTLPLPCVWLCFSCNHTGFWCCFSLICFTGMTDCCSPKCILTAPHHGFPRHQKLPANFLPFVSLFLVSIVLEYNVSGPVLFLQCCNCAHCFPVGLFGSEGTKRQGFGQEGLNAQKAMGECLFVTMKNSKRCGSTLKVLVFAILTQKTRGEHARHAMWSLNNSLILSIWAISPKCCGMKQGFSLVSSCFVCGFQLCHIPSFNNK